MSAMSIEVELLNPVRARRACIVALFLVPSCLPLQRSPLVAVRASPPPSDSVHLEALNAEGSKLEARAKNPMQSGDDLTRSISKTIGMCLWIMRVIQCVITVFP